MQPGLLGMIWQYSARQQMVIVFLTCLSFPILYYSLEIPKIIINDALSGSAAIAEILGFEFGQVEFLVFLCFALLALIIVNGLLKMRINTLKGIVGERLIRRLRFQLVDRILHFPLSHFSRTSQGELISSLTAEAEPLAGYVSESIALPLFQGGTMLTILVFMFAQDWVFGLVSVALIPVQGYVIPKLQRQVNLLRKERVLRVRKLSERLGETISGAQEIRLHGTGRYTMAEFSHWLGGLFDIRLQIFHKKFFMKFLNNTIGQITPFMFYLFGGFLVIKGDVTIGALVAALSAYKDLTSPWKELLNHYQAHEDTKIRYQQLKELFSPGNLIEISDTGSPGKYANLRLPIIFNNVSWVNESGERPIAGMNLTVAPGSRTAITGQNAIQRLRLAQLITGLEQPTSGSILLADTELCQVNNHLLRTRMAYQGPDPHIFSGSITENVLFGLNQVPPPTDETSDGYAEWASESTAAGNSTDNFFGAWTDYRLVGVETQEEVMDWYLQVARAMGSDVIMYQRGLLEVFDPEDHPGLAADLLEARRRIQSRLRAENLDRVVSGFNPDIYNRNATVAENILFGTSTDDTLQPHNLAAHPYLQQVLAGQGILETAIDIGGKASLRLSQRVQELPLGHSLLNEFDLDSEEDISALSDLALKLGDEDTQLDDAERAQLLGVFLHLVPEHHAFGFIDERLALKLLRARHEFRVNLPADMRENITPFDLNAYHPGLSVIDNLLFGRVVTREPAAERRITQIVEETLLEMDLRRSVIFLLAQSQVGIRGARIPVIARHRISVSRMLMKKPDILIFHDALSPFDIEDKRTLRHNIRELLPESTMIWIDRDIDNVLEFDRIYTLTEDGGADLRGGSQTREGEMSDDALNIIGQSSVFGMLHASRQQLLAENSKQVSAHAGEFVYLKGDPSRNVYLIISGNARSLRDENTPDLVSGNLVPGECFGLMDMLARRPRALSIRADSDLELLRISGDVIQEIIEGDSAVIQDLLRAITEQWSSISR